MAMTKKERFLAAVKGGAVDRPPLTAWVHFQSDHLSAVEVADLHEAFFNAYDFDILKVMNDYRYPVPEGVRTLDDPEALKQYTKLSLDHPVFATQLEVLRILRERMGPDIPMVETLFEPYQQILRNVGFGESDNFFNNKALALEAVECVTETTLDYLKAARSTGIDGVFLSINGAIPKGQPRGVTPEQHDTFQAPFAKRVLEGAEGLVRILHIHGNHLEIDRAMDYPCEVVHVSDRLSHNPTLSELRKLTDKCLMGGINETRIQEYTLPEIEREVDDSFAQAGKENFILGPGCTIPSFTSARNLLHLREYSAK